jgi:predicted P-loop ATPase
MADGDGDGDGTRDWMRLLRGPTNGDPWPTLDNCLIILANDREFTGTFGYNSFTQERVLLRAPPTFGDDQTEVPGPYPRPWQDEDVSLVCAYVQRIWARKFTRSTVSDAMLVVARQQTFHPILDWIDTIEWDRVKRIDGWLASAFDARNEFDPLSPDPEEVARWKAKRDYHAAVGAKFLIAAVRRLRQPGCKFDYLMILEGVQRLGKSTAVATLFGRNWFSDAVPPDLKNKDAALALQGLWCLEFAEIEHLVRTEIETIKAFLSRAVDHYRPPYGRGFISVPRCGVLCGSTNSDDYLRDATGNTRMWPVYCKTVDLRWIELNRDQLWAEAAAREAEGEVLWLDDKGVQGTAATTTADRLAGEVWEPIIIKWLHEPDTIISASQPLTTPRVLEFAIGMSKDKMTRAAEMRVGMVLRSLGYQRKVGKLHGKSIRVWRMPDVVPDAEESDEEGGIGFDA